NRFHTFLLRPARPSGCSGRATPGAFALVPRPTDPAPGGSCEDRRVPDQLQALAARCLTVGIQGTAPSPEALELVRRGVGGVIIFARNVVHPEQVAALSQALKRAAPGPLLLSIDQEGGRVQRLRAPHWTELPSMRRLGEQPAQAAAEAGALLGRELSACGIDLDYAPVLDVDTNPANPVIGERSFSRD